MPESHRSDPGTKATNKADNIPGCSLQGELVRERSDSEGSYRDPSPGSQRGYSVTMYIVWRGAWMSSMGKLGVVDNP